MRARPTLDDGGDIYFGLAALLVLGMKLSHIPREMLENPCRYYLLIFLPPFFCHKLFCLHCVLHWINLAGHRVQFVTLRK